MENICELKLWQLYIYMCVCVCDIYIATVVRVLQKDLACFDVTWNFAQNITMEGYHKRLEYVSPVDIYCVVTLYRQKVRGLIFKCI